MLRLFLEGIAPSGPAPAFPAVLHDDGVVLALNKPAGLLAHPAGSTYTWGVISLAKAQWPERRVDLVHRLDRDTSGVQLLTFDLDANRFLKARLHDEGTVKEYVALCKGLPTFEALSLTGPIGPEGGPIRVRNAVRDDGLPARTDVTVLGVQEARGLTMVRCRIFTGRTHQIRVHLAHAGLPLLGDRLYGVPEAVALRGLEEGVDPDVLAAAGAPRQALHAERVRVPHPAGGWLDVTAPLADDLAAWWTDPGSLAP